MVLGRCVAGGLLACGDLAGFLVWFSGVVCGVVGGGRCGLS